LWIFIAQRNGAIHESQKQADVERQAPLQSLGIRFGRITTDQIERDLPRVLQKIRETFKK